MGADFTCRFLPKCELKPERKNHLLSLVDGLSRDEISDLADSMFGERLSDFKEGDDSPEAVDARSYDEDIKSRTLSGIREAIEEYFRDLDGRRDVGSVKFDGIWWLTTGGMTWGDPPTEAYTTFEAIGYVDKIFKCLEEWAKADELASSQHEGSGLFKTIFRIEVLSDQPCTEMDIDAVIHHATDGDFSMLTTVESVREISRVEMASELVGHASDPDFLLGEDGWKYALHAGDEVNWTDPETKEVRTIRIEHITIKEQGGESGNDIASIDWNFPDGAEGGNLECFLHELS